jgi:histidinol-phosphate aminotransferase
MSYFCDRIERMTAYVPGEQPEDPGVIKINTNENPYPPSPAVMAAVRAVREDHLRRYPNPTSKPFRCAAAKLFGVTPEMVICSNGMDELLRMLIQACCDAGRPVGYPTPTYTLYSVLAETIGAPTRGVPFPPDFSLPVDPLAATDARLFLIVNPNSPTGTFVPVEDIARLAGQVEGRALVGVDEAYVDFARDNAMRLVRQFPNVIVMRTLSKGYSLAGLRFGFAVAPEPIIATLNKVKDSYNLDSIAIAAATAAIGDQAYARATWRKVVQEREKLVPKLRAMGFDVLPSQSNFVLATAPKPGAGAIYQGLKGRGILVRWWDAEGMSDKLRITVGTPEQNAKLVDAMTEIIAGATGRGARTGCS